MVDNLSEEKALALVHYWADGSKDDLESALSIFSKAERYTASLFFLHLAIEKKLKAAYVKKTKCHAPFTHNLLVLIEKLGWETTKEFTESYLAKGKDFLQWIEANSQNA
jgi:HEPN domain-containing protein